MGHFLKIGAIAGLSTSLTAVGASAQCNLSRVSDGVAGSPVYASSAGVPTVYFRAKMAVNTDGSSRSYHPQDPRGQSRALNNMGNAVTAIYNAQGQRIDCAPRKGDCYQRYISTFEAARDA